MKLRSLIRASTMALLIFAADLHADPASHAALLKERDAVLSKIVNDLEVRNRAGGPGPEAVLAARVALHSFRRDSAQAPAEKIQQQELIVALREKHLADMKVNLVSDPIDVLRATDALLEAKQVLESLRPDEKKS